MFGALAFFWAELFDNRICK